MMTLKYLSREISYDADTGFFHWVRSGKGRILGRCAGGRASDGYILICINGHRYPAHRLAWLFVHGEWPSGQIDHINRIKSDNRIANLRLAHAWENAHNKGLQSNNTSGAKGVRFKKGAWEASFMVRGNRVYLGRYRTVSEAVAARDAFGLAHAGAFFSPVNQSNEG